MKGGKKRKEKSGLAFLNLPQTIRTVYIVWTVLNRLNCLNVGLSAELQTPSLKGRDVAHRDHQREGGIRRTVRQAGVMRQDNINYNNYVPDVYLASITR